MQIRMNALVVVCSFGEEIDLLERDINVAVKKQHNGRRCYKWNKYFSAKLIKSFWQEKQFY